MTENAIATTDTNIPADVKPPQTREETRFRVPPVDIYETSEGIEVLADLPGVPPDGVEVKVDNGILTISGRVAKPSESADIYREFTLLNYYRQFQLNDSVDTGRIDAELKHGVLRVRLPKAEAAKPRQIEVKVA